jgi:hypothetical protein
MRIDVNLDVFLVLNAVFDPWIHNRTLWRQVDVHSVFLSVFDIVCLLAFDINLCLFFCERVVVLFYV